MNKLSKIFIIVGISLILISLTLFFTNIYNDYNASKISKKNYEIIKNTTINNEVELNENTIKIDDDEYIGIIDIPSLNLKLPVASTWNYEKMKKSPCRYYGSLENNDLVISAHSYKSQFGLIKNLNQGDKLIFTDVFSQVYVYEVKVVEILSPTDVEEMINSEFDLTLYTCTKDSKNRVTVRLNKIDDLDVSI